MNESGSLNSTVIGADDSLQRDLLDRTKFQNLQATSEDLRTKTLNKVQASGSSAMKGLVNTFYSVNDPITINDTTMDMSNTWDLEGFKMTYFAKKN